jgi:hypothetical protein
VEGVVVAAVFIFLAYPLTDDHGFGFRVDSHVAQVEQFVKIASQQETVGKFVEAISSIRPYGPAKTLLLSRLVTGDALERFLQAIAQPNQEVRSKQ